MSIGSNSLPIAFDSLRLPYKGAVDTIRCIEVDLDAGRVYAAGGAQGLLVWDLTTHRPLASLRHPHWVNAVRCFPAASRSTLEPPRTPSPSEEPTASASQPPWPSVPRCILSACEDGVLSAWSPITFRVKAQIRPSLGPLTQLYLLPHTCCSASDAPIAVQEDGTSTSLVSPSLCFAVSLENIFVIRVAATTLEPVFRFVQPTLCTSVAFLDAQDMTYMLAGQQDGSIVTWDLRTGEGVGTLRYPSVEEDVARDAYCDVDAADGESNALVHIALHCPRLKRLTGVLTDTFDYNTRRSWRLARREADQDDAALQCDNSDPALTPTDNAGWQASVPGDLTCTTADVVANDDERLSSSSSSTTDSDACCYDRRRVTCLCASEQAGRRVFYSGHATGEVLVWQALYAQQPLLLIKRLRLFSPASWVYNLLIVHTAQPTSVATPSESWPHPPSPTPQIPSARSSQQEDKETKPRADKPAGRKKARRKTRGSVGASRGRPARRSTTHDDSDDEDDLLPKPSQEDHGCDTVFIAWSDRGEIRYVRHTKDELRMTRHGPGFLATAACHWRGPPLALRAVLPTEVTLGMMNILPTGHGKATAGHATATLPAHSTAEWHDYVIMGGFEGRVERYDLGCVLARLRRD